MKRTLGLFFILSISWTVWAYEPNTDQPLDVSETPKQLENVGITERQGEKLDLSIPFQDDQGQQVTLGKYFQGEKPVLMTMVYYGCPSLCNYHLNGLTTMFKNLDLKAGRDFEFVAVSMDHKENDLLASEKKATYIEELGEPEAAKGWHFLTGTEENVKKLADQLGFRFRWDPRQKEYAHAAAAFVLTPSAVISRYLHGIEFVPQTLKLSLVEASQGKIGSIIDQVILYCFQFDPKTNKYTLYAYNTMRVGAILFLIVLALIVVPMWLREKRRITVEGDK